MARRDNLLERKRKRTTVTPNHFVSPSFAGKVEVKIKVDGWTGGRSSPYSAVLKMFKRKRRRRKKDTPLKKEHTR